MPEVSAAVLIALARYPVIGVDARIGCGGGCIAQFECVMGQRSGVTVAKVKRRFEVVADFSVFAEATQFDEINQLRQRFAGTLFDVGEFRGDSSFDGARSLLE